MEEEKLKKLIEKGINSIIEEGLEISDLDNLYKLVDIHKDLANEEYWEKKKEAIEMRYRGYGEQGYGRENYGRESYGRRSRDSRGRYKESGRGGSRSYRGEEMMEEMQGAYQNYSAGKEEMEMGNYGAKHDTMKSLEYMLESVVDFIEMLKKDANSQEEVQLIKEYTKEISEL